MASSLFGLVRAIAKSENASSSVSLKPSSVEVVKELLLVGNSYRL